MDKTIFIVHAAATFFMTGVIWVIQLLHYPVFSRISPDKFIQYHDEHRMMITPIVGPAMLIELAGAIFLLFSRPDGFDARLLWFAFFLVAAIWASTAFLQIPLHEKLATGFDAAAHSSLVATNWIRTIAWSLRSVILLWLFWKTSLS